MNSGRKSHAPARSHALQPALIGSGREQHRIHAARSELPERMADIVPTSIYDQVGAQRSNQARAVCSGRHGEHSRSAPLRDLHSDVTEPNLRRADRAA